MRQIQNPTKISSDEKFAPPIFDPKKHLRRNLESLMLPTTERELPRFVFVEAQAGQGKTTFVAQFLTQFECPVCWYRMEGADKSPAFFIDSLIAGLTISLPDFKATEGAALRSNSVEPDQYCALLDQALSAFGQSLKSHFILILDDIHLCQASEGTFSLLCQLIKGSPKQLHLIFLARHNLSSLIQKALKLGPVVNLDDSALAFSALETASLFNALLHTPLTRKAVQALQQLTDGWVMGLLLVEKSLKAKDPLSIEETLGSAPLEPKHLVDYFLRQILLQLPREQRDVLLTLSLLDSIPLELACAMTDCDEVGSILNEMVQSNLFIRALNNEQSIFALHHLFREGLRQLALREKSPLELQRLYRLAGSWYRECQQPDQAIRFFISGGDFTQAEQTLRQASINFRSRHRLTELCLVMDGLSQDILSAHPWFAYYFGLGLMTENPQKALPLLTQALEGFVVQEDGLGELLVSAEIMLFSVGLDGNYARGSSLLKRTMELFEAFVDDLQRPLRGHVANVFILANTFFRFEPEQVDRFFSQGINIARSEKLVSLEIEARMARLFFLIFSGDWRRCRQELEVALPMLRDPLCNKLHKGAIALAYMSYLKESGDFSTYVRQKEIFHNLFATQLRQGSVYEDYVLLWDLHMSLARGDDLRAWETLEIAYASEGAASRPHLSNLFQQHAALLAAEEGRTEEALAVIHRSHSLRKEVGGDYFYTLNNAFYGAVFGLIGDDKKALECFAAVLQSPSLLLRETALAFRAHFFLSRGNDQAAGSDLKALLSCMRASEHCYFYGWRPELVLTLLSAAVRQRIEVTFAKQLAMQKLDFSILDDGRCIPLIEIKALGSMQIYFKHQRVLSDIDFSESQRQLLATLLSCPTCSSSQERLQTLLWPESDARRARNNFDKLLSRLRKTFHAALGEDSDQYLQLKNGILSVCHCRVDAHDFKHKMQQGIESHRQGNDWQAERLLQESISSYGGEFLPCIVSNEMTENVRRDLQLAYQSGALTLAGVLEHLQEPRQALSVLEKALEGDPTNDEVNKKVYDMLIRYDTPTRAQTVIENYADALRMEGFTAREIEETLECYWV